MGEVARPDLGARAVVELHLHAARDRVPEVLDLAAVGAGDRLHALAPLPTRLERGPPDLRPSTSTISIFPLSNVRVSSGLDMFLVSAMTDTSGCSCLPGQTVPRLRIERTFATVGPWRGYAELHCHTNFSFLDGASHPEELAVEAARLGLAALAITDHDGFYGAVRFALAAREHGLPTVFGAEITLGITRPANGEPDPEGEHLLVLAEGPVGYARLARAISEAQMAGEKGAPRTTVDALARAARAPVHLHPEPSAGNDSWYVLTGCRKGTVPAALVRDGPAAARAALDHLVAGFGRERVLVELWDHGDPIDRHRNDALARVAMAAGVDVVATNNVHYATPAQRPLATALAAVRSGRSLDEIDGWLPAAPFAHLRSAGEQERRFARWPGAVARTVDLARACAFDLRLAAPELPDHDVPDGHTEMTWLRELTARGARVRYPSTHPTPRPRRWGRSPTSST